MSVYEPLESNMNGSGGDVLERSNGRRARLVRGRQGTKDDRSACTDVESISLASVSTRNRHHHSAELSEPLTANTDPFYVFRDDLLRQLERMDESLAEYLRLVNQSVSCMVLSLAVTTEIRQYMHYLTQKTFSLSL